MSDIYGNIRTLGLWLLIVCDLALLAILFFTKEYVWFTTFTGITLWIVGLEIYGMTIGFKNKDGVLEKKTISTTYKQYIQRVGWIGYVVLVLFLLAMFGLAGMHLPFWGGMFG